MPEIEMAPSPAVLAWEKIVLILHTNAGDIGKFLPEYHFSSRMAPSQLKKPWVMKSDMRGKNFPDITQVMVCNITIISG